MAWVRKFFKGKQKVWVEVDEAGAFVTDEKGLVPMRYKNDDEAQLYTIHPSNLGADAPSSSAKDPAAKKPKKSAAKKTAAKPAGGGPSFPGDEQPGQKITSTQLPPELESHAPPEPGTIEVFTDGACQGNPGPCSYGLLLRAGDHYKEVSQYLGQGTNNIGELMAIRVALETIEVRHLPVRLHTDSSYCIGTLTKNWKIKVNRELILATRALVNEFDDLKFIKVKGHSGLPLNERVDQLAVSAIDSQRALATQED